MLITPSSNTHPTAHFIGIGGTGMVAGARLALEAGWKIRGSDGPLYPPASHMVEALGVPVAQGYGAENLDWNPDLVVIGNALSRGNPEVEAVLERGLHYVSLPEWLKDVVLRARRPIAVCGTHGKTTTTAMTAYLLDRGGRAPGFFVGGQVQDFPHSARLGDPDVPFAIEGDEYDTAFFDKRAKFFHYLPHTAVVTSLEFDHGDIYDTLESIERAFRLMLRQIPASGLLITCADAPRAKALTHHAPCAALTYGHGEESDVRIDITNITAEATTFEMILAKKAGQLLHAAHEAVAGNGTVASHERIGPFQCPLPGNHNVSNAAAAVLAAYANGATWESMAQSLGAFKGIKRRMEVFLEREGVTYIDDFAHHPTAIRETIAAARQRYAGRRLIVCFEPRSNTTVTQRFQNQLANALVGADELWLGPIHRPEKIADPLDRAALCQSLTQRGTPAHFTDHVPDIAQNLREHTRPNDVVLILSNGAFGGLYQQITDPA